MSAANGTARVVALADLLDGIAAIPTAAAAAVGIRDLTLDSREVQPGGLFLALRGRGTHGLMHAEEAVRRGAVAVLWERAGSERPAALPPSVFAAPVEALARHAGAIADRFFGRPSAALDVHGITGTNGKTTSAYLLAQTLTRLGSRTGYLGTLGWGVTDALQAQGHTTPDVVTVHRRLAAMRAAGMREAAVEVSSHALDQGRVDGVRFASAAFTNLSRDHHDNPGTMQAYGDAKSKLFETRGLRRIVVNAGDEFGRELLRRHAGGAPRTAVWVGATDTGAPAEQRLQARQVAAEPRGLRLALAGTFGATTLRTPLIGRFNAENALLVLGIAAAAGAPLAEAAAALAAAEPPPGRMHVVATDRADRPLAVIDYAHTPDALAKALGALREHCRGALWCVFGCGGDRDAGKRALMGAVADGLADQLIVTDDNPRSEDPAAITAAILAGIETHPARVIHDRARAIAAALAGATAGDVVLIAGKGHEDYQIYGDRRRAFSDLVEARRALGEAA
jgi:UDP-N-acetylmuramoyl-L-alanyl-D-glutamate--2,6-diaminopimelate ligase